MLGHHPILKMRLAGKRPRIVFINDFPSPEARDWHLWGEHATVQIDAGDFIPGLDLRFLTGLTVSATGRTEARAKALFAACKRAGATTVAAVHAIGIGTPHVESGWTEIYHALQGNDTIQIAPARHLAGSTSHVKHMTGGVVASNHAKAA